MAVDWSPVVVRAQEELARDSGNGKCRHTWSVLKRWAGLKNAYPEHRQGLQNALATVGLTTVPPVDVVIPDGKQKIDIVPIDAAPRKMRLRFASESELEQVIADSMPGVAELPGVELVDTQYSVPGGRIDVLGRRRLPKNAWRWVIIEVEHGDGKYEAATQVLQYVTKLRQKTVDGEPLVSDRDEVEVVVISQDENEDAVKHLKASADDYDLADARWFAAEISLKEI